MLSYIAATLPGSRPYKRSASARSDGSSLPEDISQWLVEWDEICLERCCGRGSFGWGAWLCEQAAALLAQAMLCQLCLNV